eukprot:scaffold6400_cov143-Skeletonema_dohrnii-CCMP3373.AAC.3
MSYTDRIKESNLCWLGLTEDYAFSDRIGLLTMNWLGLKEEYAISTPLVLGFILAALILRHATSLYQWSLKKPESSPQRAQHTKVLRKQMTPIGKFALASQTENRQSIITFFIALSNKIGHQPMGITDFERLWESRIMSEKRHERFDCCVSSADGYFEKLDKLFHDYASEPTHPDDIQETKERIIDFLTRPIDVHDKLWQVELSNGALGTSGAILHSNELKAKGHNTETLALFRNHHCLCDGVSLSAAVADLSNESEELRDKILYNIETHKQRILRTSFIRRALSFIVGSLTYYVFGSIVALTLQAWNMIVSSNPFEEFMKRGSCAERSVSWKYLASVEDAKRVTKSIKKGAKLNDLFVACLTSAIERQYECLSRNNRDTTSVNLIVTTHLRGGIILPGESIGNKIGAFAVTTPFKTKAGSSIKRLRTISKALQLMKRTPAPQISYLITSFISNYLPKRVAQYALVKANCHSVATISNVHGFPETIHWAGNPVEMICAFLPLPTGIPIGIVVTSYNGRIIMSVDADASVVPDADEFLQWMVDEYETIKSEAETSQ